MSTVAERMAAKLRSTPRSEQGAPCTSCGTTALACQLEFVLGDEVEWCCATCRREGAKAMHREDLG